MKTWIKEKRSLFIRYGLAIILVKLSLLTAQLLDPLIGNESPFLLIFGAIIISSWYGGTGPGIFATLFTAILANYFFLPLHNVLHQAGSSIVIQLGLFILEGLAISFVIPMIKSARLETKMIQKRNDELERRFTKYTTQTEELLIYLTNYDLLTGLSNRNLFLDRLTQALTRAPWRKRLIAVAFLDLDHFKRINDSLGYHQGNLLLKEIAKRLSTCVRSGDTVSRWSGDEFILLLEDIAQKEDIPKIIQKIVDGLSKPFKLEDQEIIASASIGVSFFPNDGNEADKLLKDAEIAMYLAKEQGRNNYQFYSPAMNPKISNRLGLETSLRHAVEKEEFILHYQPFVDIGSGQITGMEALLRWQNPECGMIPPAEFIPLAEETGLIIPLGEWVLRTACKQNKAWQNEGLPPLRIAVNLSSRQFQQQTLIKKVQKILNETGLDPKYLELELTESILMQNVENAIKTLDQFHKMGIEISIDDFGTGYSSLSYLRRFSVNSLKIDRSFVKDITKKSGDMKIVIIIITLAHSLGLRVIAEGVETEDQLNFLKSLQCHEMQGYLFSPPLAAEEFKKLLIEKKHLWSLFSSQELNC